MATKIGRAAQEIARMNPWWRSAVWHEADTDLRAVRESGLGYRSTCLDNLTRGGLYLLRGPRRIGKTVSVKQAIRSLLDKGIPALTVIRMAADGWTADDLRTAVQNVALPPAPAEVTRLVVRRRGHCGLRRLG